MTVITTDPAIDPATDPDRRLRDPDPALRLGAIAELAAHPRRGAADTLAWALADADPEVRRAAADALRALPETAVGEDGVTALQLAARAADPRVREIAAGLLARLAARAGSLYSQGLHDGEPHLRVQAVKGLVLLRAVTAAAEAADDPAREVRVAVADGLAVLAATTRPRPCSAPAASPEIVVAALDQLLGDHDPVVRIAALDAAAAWGLPEPLAGRAVVAAGHASWQVRRHAVQALAAATPETAIAPLVRALRDRIIDVRRAAVRSLEGWRTDPAVIAALTETLADPDPGVRTQARWALA